MTKFNNRRFSVSAPINESYAKNYEATFGKKSRDNSDGRVRPDGSVREYIAPARHSESIRITRAELEKWLKELEFVRSIHHVATVRESIRLVLQADDMGKEKQHQPGETP